MDDPGYRARRRADKEQHAAYLSGHGGQALAKPLTDEEIAAVVDLPGRSGLAGYEVPNYRPPGGIDPGQVPGALQGGEGLQGTESHAGPHKDSPEAAKTGMNPHLQLMCGPMLRYDTVENGIYHAFALVVVANEGSDYSRRPYISWKMEGPSSLEAGMQRTSLNSSQLPSATAEGNQIYVYHGLGGTHTFWRFKFEIPLADHEARIAYSLNGGKDIHFFVPALTQNFRWVGHSCNGFSSGVKVEDFNGPSPLWEDLLENHQEKPYHCLVGGGDQIYCDPLAREPEFVEWIAAKDETWKAAAPMTEEMRFGLDRFFFNHYCSWFRAGAFGRAISRIPMMNMLDDHDLIDGFGSYPDALQQSPVFSTIGGRGYFWYLLFQNFIVDEVDGTSPVRGQHTFKSMIIGGEGAYIPFPNHSFLSYFGPNQAVVMLDCRAERKKDRICTSITYDRIFAEINKLPAAVQHLCVLLGVPIAYPRMIFAEKFLESSFNPLTLLSKTGIALSGFTNNFNSDAELLDDLSDHWCARDHKDERNWLVLECAKAAKANSLRVTFLSGDVHAGCAAKFFTKSSKHVAPEEDPNYMINLISSAIVNTPPPAGMISFLNKICTKTHKTLHKHNIDENMISLFEIDTDGKKQNNKYIIGRRNYVAIDVLPDGTQQWDMRVEIKQGDGKTKSYPVIAPAVHY